MSAHSENGCQCGTKHVLRWTKPVLTADDLRTSLNGHRTVTLTARAIVTPLAADWLRHHDIQVERGSGCGCQVPETSRSLQKQRLGCAQERAYPMVQSALRTLDRNGVAIVDMPTVGQADRWARAVGECIARGDCCGGAVFCSDASLVCCVANKVPGLRAAAVATVDQATRATYSLGANLLIVEMPGKTFFEVRQILATLCATPTNACPTNVACTLRELDGHAHR
jgi:ribose 5-phosphate isomerase B